MTDDSSGYEDPKAQASNGHRLLPSQFPLEQNNQIVRQDTQAQGGLCSPKILAGQIRQPIASIQLLDNVFAGRSPIILPPYGQRFFGSRQIGHQPLVERSRAI